MNTKKWWLLTGVIIVILCLIIGSKVYMDKQKEAEEMQEEMIEIVKSDEARSVFEEGLKNLDPKALTAEGVIQTYEIDYESIEHNPMGGINVSLYVNGDKELYIRKTLNKFDGKSLEGGGGGHSSELEKIIKEPKNDK